MANPNHNPKNGEFSSGSGGAGGGGGGKSGGRAGGAMAPFYANLQKLEKRKKAEEAQKKASEAKSQHAPAKVQSHLEAHNQKITDMARMFLNNGSDS